MKWDEIERAARLKYNLSDEWQLCAANASDKEVMQVELGIKGPRGGWKRGRSFKGFIVYRRDDRKA